MLAAATPTRRAPMRHHRLLAASLLVALGLTACGGDDNDDPGDGTSTTLDEHAQEHAESGDHGEHEE
jgi:hypothetical protein